MPSGEHSRTRSPKMASFLSRVPWVSFWGTWRSAVHIWDPIYCASKMVSELEIIFQIIKNKHESWEQGTNFQITWAKVQSYNWTAVITDKSFSFPRLWFSSKSNSCFPKCVLKDMGSKLRAKGFQWLINRDCVPVLLKKHQNFKRWTFIFLSNGINSEVSHPGLV